MLKSWIIYCVLVVATAVINRIKPGYVSSISFYVVLLIPAVNLLHVSFSYHIFQISHDISKRIVAKGDTIEYSISIINPSFILLAPFSLHFTASDKLFREVKNQEDHHIIISERSEVVIHQKLICAYRGNYNIGVNQVFVQDFFGFFKFKYNEIEQPKILVYPKLRELKSNLLRQVVNESSESIVSNTSQNQSVFTDLRDYIPGDSLNKIHWKMSAKAGKFITKDFSGQMTNKTKVFLDTYSLNLSDENRVVYEDYMVEGCVSLVHFLLENSIHTHLYYDYYGKHKLEGRSSHDFSMFYDDLAKLSFYKEQKFVDFLSSTLRIDQDTCHLIIMTQKISLQLVEHLIRLKLQNYEVSLVICDPKNLDLDEIESISTKSRFMLTTSCIPIYHMQHDENSTMLEVS